MPVIYGLISRGADVLAEYTSSKGNFSTVTRVLLKKISAEDGKLSYIYDEHVFHYMVSDGLTYLCMTDRNFSRKMAFTFLEELEDHFIDTYGARAKVAIAYSLNADFQRVIKQKMDTINATDDGSNKIREVQDQIDMVKGVMVKNIETVLERGEKIDILVDKSESLEQNAFKFHRSAKTVRRRFWWKNVKMWLLLAFVVLVILYMILSTACGGLTLPKCT